MAAYTFDGQQSQTIDNFDPTADTLTISLSPSQIADVRDNNGTTTILTTAGATLTLTNVDYSQLAANPASIELPNGADFTFSNGTATGTALGDVLVGSTGADTLNAAGGNNLVFGGGSFSASVDGGDTITTGNGNDTIYGNAGNDTINAGSGNDLVFGGLDSDQITVSAQVGQTVTVYGGGSANDSVDGADTISVLTSAGSALVYGNAGADTITIGSNGANTVYGGLGNDTIGVTSNGANLIVGGVSDADQITVTGSGNNTIYGGSGLNAQDDGNDVISVSGGGDNLVYGNGGNDTVTINGGNGDNTVYGGFGDDSVAITGNGNNLVVGGLADADTITIVGNGNNTIYGGSATDTVNDGNDLISVNGSGSNLIYANGGDDRVTVLGGGDNTVYGGLGDDSIFLGATGAGNAATGDNLLVGGTGTNSFTIFSEGNTTVYGGDGQTDAADLVTTITATLSGGESAFYTNAGDDVVTATLTNDAALMVNLGVGSDTLTITAASADSSAVLMGNDGVDTISYTGGGDVSIYGGSSATDATADIDTINLNLASGGSAMVYGNGGDDLINATVGGAASIFGGLGDDNIQINSGAGTVFIQAGTGSDTVDLTGFTGSSTIYGGNSINDSVDGADTIIGGAGNDLIYGNGGNDVISTGDGNDTIFGGAGADTFNITGSSGAKVIGDYSSEDTLTINSTGITAVGATTVADSSGNTVITLDNGQTITLTGAANERIEATFGSGSELIRGTSGADTITGSANGDILIGGAGNDTITGLAGADTMTGGVGNDVFRYTAFNESGATTTTTDTITDLNLGTNVSGGRIDSIDLPGTITFTTGAGAAGVPSTTLGVSAATAVTAASLDAAIAAMANAAGDATHGQAAIFSIGGDLYLVAETGANHSTFDATTDIAIKVNGVTGTLDASDIG